MACQPPGFGSRRRSDDPDGRDQHRVHGMCGSAGRAPLSAHLLPVFDEDAFLPQPPVTHDQGLPLSRTLDPAVHDIASPTIQSAIAPTSSSATSWRWSDKVPAVDPIQVSIVDVRSSAAVKQSHWANSLTHSPLDKREVPGEGGRPVQDAVA